MRPPVPISEALRAAWGSPTGAALLDSSPRSRVWRTEFPGRGRVIVKQITEAGGGGTDAAARYAREAVALRLAAGGGGRPVAPALLAVDPERHVLYLEFLEHLGPVDDWLPGYAEALADLHARTGPADAGLLPAWSGPTAADADSFLAFARALGVRVPRRVPGELAGLLDRLDPAGHHALLHGDPCPGNDVRTATGVRFLDFEGAALGNGLVELAYLRIGFPTCWCAMTVPATPLTEAEDVYRSTWRSRTGSEVPGDLADACAGWLIRGDALVERAHRNSVDQLARVPQTDFTWGHVSARERLVHRLGAVAELTRGHDELPALGQLCSDLADRLLRHGAGLRPLPSYRTRPWY